MESLIAYLNNQEYIINVDTNQIAQLSVFEYVDGNDKFELIIDTSKGVYLINKVDFNYQQRIPSYIIIKIIESLKKAGFKQVKICEEE
jgi:hypothetical protein